MFLQNLWLDIDKNLKHLPKPLWRAPNDSRHLSAWGTMFWQLYLVQVWPKVSIHVSIKRCIFPNRKQLIRTLGTWPAIHRKKEMRGIFIVIPSFTVMIQPEMTIATNSKNDMTINFHPNFGHFKWLSKVSSEDRMPKIKWNNIVNWVELVYLNFCKIISNTFDRKKT